MTKTIFMVINKQFLSNLHHADFRGYKPHSKETTMPDLHMSFLTPGDHLRLERQVDLFALCIKSEMDLQKDPDQSLVIWLTPIGGRSEPSSLQVTRADWEKSDRVMRRAVLELIKTVIHPPCNMSELDYLELFFLRVSHSLGCSMVFRSRSDHQDGYWRIEMSRHRSAPTT